MKHKKHNVTFVRSAVLLACLTAGGGAWAQLSPWTCDDMMYVGRTTGTGTDIHTAMTTVTTTARTTTHTTTST